MDSINFWGVIAETVIGINLWFAPQISLHCPTIMPTRFAWMINWLIRPGTASTFTPNDGIVQEWITSSEDTNNRIVVFVGIIIWLDVSNNRIKFDSCKNESKDRFFISEYSYDQYHWCPITLMVRAGEWYSSVIYRIFNDGNAKNNSKKAGSDVQKYSTSWFSVKYRLKNEFVKAV